MKMMQLLNSKILKVILLMCVIPFIAQAQELENLLNTTKQDLAPDARTAIWEVNASNSDGHWILKGKIDNNITKQELLSRLQASKIKYIDSIKVLEYQSDKPWGLVKLAVASLRTQGRHAAEMATQAIMGTPVKILEKDGDWYRVQTPDDYISYVPGNSLQLISQIEFDKWRKAKRYIITAYQSHLVENPLDDTTVSDLVMGDILEYIDSRDNMVQLQTPDGRKGFVNAADVAEFSSWAQQNFDAQTVEKNAKRMMGSGYLWGGTSTKITDCSGLAKVAYFSNAIILQRDASQQANTGTIISPQDWAIAELGDLVFFGTKTGKVTHVGIYLSNGKYIHCSGRVKINSVNPADSDYLSTPFLSISRINHKVGTKGITAVKNHIWYF